MTKSELLAELATLDQDSEFQLNTPEHGWYLIREMMTELGWGEKRTKEVVERGLKKGTIESRSTIRRNADACGGSRCIVYRFVKESPNEHD